MRTAQLFPGVYLAVGDAYESNCVAFIRGPDALLIDALGSTADAEHLLDFVTNLLGKRVRLIVCTHYFSDHIAALRLFPEADILAHESYRQTAESEEFVSEQERAFFVEPSIVIADRLSIRWGDHTLNIFHNPGHTMSSLAIEVPEADLLFTGDTLVGNIVYLRYSTPELMAAALHRLQVMKTSRIISSHGVPRSRRSIDYAMLYLMRLGEHAASAFLNGTEAKLVELPIEKCLDPALEGTDFERTYHQRNLQTILERRLFAPPV
jgi:cyclase